MLKIQNASLLLTRFSRRGSHAKGVNCLVKVKDWFVGRGDPDYNAEPGRNAAGFMGDGW